MASEIITKGLPFDSNELTDPETGDTYFDRVAFSRDLTHVTRKQYSNGIVVTGTNILSDELRVVQGTYPMVIRVLKGDVIINGHQGWIEKDEELDIEVGGSLPRIDRIVYELNLPDDRNFKLRVLQGIPASTPVPPSLTRTEDVYQLSLAQVRVNAGQSTIASITDERSTQAGVANVQIGIAIPDVDMDFAVPAWGVSATAVGTQAKTVTIDNFIRSTGQLASVRFTAGNTHATPTLNISSTGAAQIRLRNAQSGINNWPANFEGIFVWDGTYWVLLNPPISLLEAAMRNFAHYNTSAAQTYPGNTTTAMLFSSTGKFETISGMLPATNDRIVIPAALDGKIARFYFSAQSLENFSNTTFRRNGTPMNNTAQVQTANGAATLVPSGSSITINSPSRGHYSTVVPIVVNANDYFQVIVGNTSSATYSTIAGSKFGIEILN